MPAVLTAAATVDCGHGGPVTIKSDPKNKLTVSGATVLTATALQGQPVNTAECSITITGPPPPGTPISTRCKTCVSITSVNATKLTVHGTPVLLAPLTGTTDGMLSNVTPLSLLKATGVQTKLSAV